MNKVSPSQSWVRTVLRDGSKRSELEVNDCWPHVSIKAGERSARKRMGQSQDTSETGSLIRWLVNSRESQICCYCSNSWVNFLWAQQVNRQDFPTPSYHPNELFSVIPRVLLTLLPQGKIAHTLPSLSNPLSNKIDICPCSGNFPWTL